MYEMLQRQIKGSEKMSKIKKENLAVNNFTYRRYSVEYFLESAKRLGISRIELSGCHPHFTVYEAEEYDTKGLAGKIMDAGLKVSAIEPEQNFLPINIAADNEYLRRQSIEQMKFFIKNAGVFDCDKVVVYPGKALINHPPSAAWNLARKSIRELCDYAKDYSVTILLLGVSDFISDIMTNSAAVKRMLEEADRENLACCVNSSAAALAGETLEDYFGALGDKIKLVQLSDSVTDNDQLVWGEGNQDFGIHFETLEKYGYSGSVVLELLMEEYAEGAEGHYRKCLDYAANYIEMTEVQ